MFMMNWFVEFEQKLPPFANYTNFIHNRKQQCSVVYDSQKFKLNEPTNAESNFLIEALGSAVAKSLLSELTDKQKATRNHLSSAAGMFSCVSTLEVERKAVQGIKAANDVAECAFGGLTYNLQKIAMTKLKSAGILAMTR